MDELIKKLERAECGSRELDGAILCADRLTEFVAWDGAGVVFRNNGSIRHTRADRVPHYTTSLDAALTLVESHLSWLVRTDGVFAQVWEPKGLGHGHWDAMAHTPPVALCIAALKARQASDQEERCPTCKGDCGGAHPYCPFPYGSEGKAEKAAG